MWHFADHLQKKGNDVKNDLLQYQNSFKTWKSSNAYLLVHFIPAFFAGRPHAHAQNEKVENDNGENAQIIDFHLGKVLSETKLFIEKKESCFSRKKKKFY